MTVCPSGANRADEDLAAAVRELTEGRRRTVGRRAERRSRPRRRRRGRSPGPSRRQHAPRGAAPGPATATPGCHRGRPGEPRQRLEVEREVARRVEPLLRVLLEAVPHDPLEARLNRLRSSPRDPAAPPAGSPTSSPPPSPGGTRAGPKASRTGSRRTRRGPTAGRRALPFTCSGDMYPSVPITTPGSVPAAVGRFVCWPPAVSFCVSFARPKSRILTRPSLVRNRFSGFRSRWMIPFSCAAASPLAICTA